MLFRRCGDIVLVLVVLLAACAQTHGVNQEHDPSDESEGDGAAYADAGRESFDADHEEDDDSSIEMDASDSDPLDAAAQGTPDGAVGVDGAIDADGALGQTDSATSTPDGDVEDGGGIADDGGSTMPDAGTAPPRPKDPPDPDDTFPTSNILDVVTEPGGPNCTIYRPGQLGPNGLRHPVVVWTNDQSEIQSFERSYSALAAMGFIVSVVNVNQPLACDGQGEEIYECLDYVLQQNENGSWRDKVDVDQLGLVGFSFAACSTLKVGQDERFGALAVIEPTILTQAADHVSIQYAAIFVITSRSGPSLGSQLPTQIFDTASPVVWARSNAVDSSSLYSGELLEYVPHWFRYKLMNDPWGSQWFRKIVCKLCDEDWFVQWNPNWVE